MRYMVIENGVATNAIEADSESAIPGLTLMQSDTADIGDIWDGSGFKKPEPEPPTQEQINAESQTYLNTTDWYVVRMAETGKPVPDDILAARQAARDAIK